jgi:hypothetical protein
MIYKELNLANLVIKHKQGQLSFVNFYYSYYKEYKVNIINKFLNKKT